MIGLVDGNNFYVSCERVFDRKLVGKPVAVLSNNDGCCVSMSGEFKALGIPCGTPYFQLRAERIFTARDLRDAADDVLRGVGGVTLVRTATELCGISCLQG